MERYRNAYRVIISLLLTFFLFANALGQISTTPDTTIIFTPSNPNLIRPQSYRPLVHAWGLDLLLSNNGFGLGAFYWYEVTDEISLTLNLAISDVKDDTEFEQYDYYGQSFVPGKKNRLLLIPLLVSIEHRLFKNDIVDNFRLFINAGFGPTMVFVAPYAIDHIYQLSDNSYINYPDKIDFFTSLKYGRPRYTLGGFIGIGVHFGMEKGTMTSISIKYFLAPFPNGIEVMEDGYMKNFGGLFITLSFGGMF
jgi:hypothetical protein